jgi:hypothetical protein
VICIEARWAPKDFPELCNSMAKLHQRLAPILSCFNNEYTWLMEWQTDQMPAVSDLATRQISQYLGIRVATIAKGQCVFRVHGTGA